MVALLKVHKCFSWKKSGQELYVSGGWRWEALDVMLRSLHAVLEAAVASLFLPRYLSFPAFSFLSENPVSLRYHFSSSWKISFSISWNGDLLATNSVFFHVKNVFMKEYFCRIWNSGWRFFYQHFKHVPLSLSSIVSDEKFVVIQIIVHFLS